MSWRLLAFLVLLTTIVACDMVDAMKDGFAHSQEVSNKLEKTVGLKPFVGFDWQNGSLMSVTVAFQGIPPNSPLSDITTKVKQAVVDEFKQKPKQIIVSFIIEP
ncbi:MAG: hypothetical protein LBE62_05975 [Azonexus sp.]|jgi:hypothetical protein|nr:hypothetical protein [Azonexus sp.]